MAKYMNIERLQLSNNENREIECSQKLPLGKGIWQIRRTLHFGGRGSLLERVLGQPVDQSFLKDDLD